MVGIYEIYWKEHLIGKLYYDKKLMKYEVIENDLQNSELVNHVVNNFDWQEPIQFFLSRIEKMNAFKKSELSYTTDNYTFKKIS